MFFIRLFLSAAGLTLALSLLPSGAAAENRLRLGVDGLGRIGASTPFDRGILERLYPGFRWKAAERNLEYGVERSLQAKARKKVWFSLISDGRGRIARIEVESPNISSWLGPRIGDSYRILARNAQLGTCRPGSEELSGAVLCRAAETTQVRYVFSGRWEGPDGVIPPDTALGDFTISRILWQPARFSGMVASGGEGPAFDCKAASSSIEKLICSDPHLARLDRQLSALFTTALDNIPADERNTLRAVQRGWIKGRNDCWKSADRLSCVEQNYRSRIAELETMSK